MGSRDKTGENQKPRSAREHRVAEHCLLQCVSGNVQEKFVVSQEILVIVSGLLLTVSAAALLNPIYTTGSALQQTDVILWTLTLSANLGGITAGWCQLTIWLWCSREQLRVYLLQNWHFFFLANGFVVLGILILLPAAIIVRLRLLLLGDGGSSSGTVSDGNRASNIIFFVCATIIILYSVGLNVVWIKISRRALGIQSGLQLSVWAGLKEVDRCLGQKPFEGLRSVNPLTEWVEAEAARRAREGEGPVSGRGRRGEGDPTHGDGVEHSAGNSFYQRKVGDS